jgi:AGZA family xanthine/uracil permease-like MFS transporter
VGIGVLLASGVFKLACAPFSAWIRRVVPRAGLLGSLVAIALVIISFLPLLEIATTPVVGLVSLVVILTTLTARWEPAGRWAWLATVAAIGFIAAFLLRYPPSPFGPFSALLVGVLAAGVFGYLLHRAGQVPGALMAVVVGGATYYLMHALGYGPGPGPRPDVAAAWSLPMPLPSWLPWARENWREVLSFLPVAIPLALATVVGGIDCAESAAAAGDDYPTGGIVAAEGFATLVGGIFGGVIQSTPYIGHPAYKAMGGRAGYTLATALFVGAAGVLGIFGWIFHVLPKAAVYPILVFVGIEITQQSFRATARRHYPALVLACIPALAYLAYLMVDRLMGEVDRVFGYGTAVGAFSPEIREWLQILTVLAGGFIVTSLLWGTALARLIDGRWGTCAGVLGLASVFSLVGIIHSPLRGTPIAWPWQVVAELERVGRLQYAPSQTPYHWAAAYAVAAGVVGLIGRFGRPGTPEADLLPHEPEEPTG